MDLHRDRKIRVLKSYVLIFPMILLITLLTGCGGGGGGGGGGGVSESPAGPDTPAARTVITGHA